MLKLIFKKGGRTMKKTLKKQEQRGQKNLVLYGCECSCYCTPCSGCASQPANDKWNVNDARYDRNYSSNFYKVLNINT